MKKNTIFTSALILFVYLISVPALSDPPAESGPNVTRFDGVFAVFVADSKAGLTVALGFDPVDFCTFFNFDFDEVSVKDVDVPSADERIVSQFSGYVRVSVWPVTIPADTPFPLWCELFLASSPLATGMVEINGTDNDLFVFTYDNTNRNAYGWNAHGEVYDESGGAHNLHASFRANWDGNNDDSFSSKTKIKYK